MSSYLARIITGKPYTQAKDTAKRILDKLPGALDAAKRVEEHVKGMITPGTLFEEMGFRYIGPVDGHDFNHLLPTLSNCKDLDGPILLHTITKKGLGFSPAEEDPETWHGLGPYNIQTGTPHKSQGKPPSYTEVFAETLADLADTDERIVAITAAMPGGTGLSRFTRRHPERCFDVGIAEQHAVTFAGGLCVAGKRPFVAIYSTFMQRAFDQIIHDICIQNLPVTFCMDRAGIVGADGATHTGMFDIAFMRMLPNMTIMAPKDEMELKHMLVTALSIDGPVAIRYPRGNGYGVPMSKPEALPIGKAEVLEEGSDGLVLAIGSRVADAREAVQNLRQEQQRAFTLLNLRFIKPLDEKSIRTHLHNGKPLVVIEEGVSRGGVGEQVAALALSAGWSGSFIHIAMPDSFPAHGTQAEILNDLGLDATAILQRLRDS
jgi:1-deoxy-D-xylulose-5-phosphate synthase